MGPGRPVSEYGFLALGRARADPHYNGSRGVRQTNRACGGLSGTKAARDGPTQTMTSGGPDLVKSAEDWDVVAQALDERMAAVGELPFQSPAARRIEATDTVTGRRVLLNPARAGRPRGGSAGVAYREGRTPPTLFYVAEGGPPAPLVETETETLSAAREWLAAASAGWGGSPPTEEEARSPWEMVSSLGDRHRGRVDGTRVPLVFPAVPWRTRTFFNLAPIVADRVSGANGFVVAVAPEYEARDLGHLRAPAHTIGAVPPGAPRVVASGPQSPSGAPSPLIPGPVFDAVVSSWALLEQWAERRDLVPVPFVNGGKGPASGQSLDCFHAQFYALGSDPLPPWYEALRHAGHVDGCPLCRLVSSRELEVAVVGSVGVWAHPAPEIEGSLVVAARAHDATIASLPDLAEFARGIETAVRSFELLLGGVPPYNVAVRSGRHVGHLHAEVIPRAGVAVAAGFEKATGFFVSTRTPARVAAELRALAVGPQSPAAGPQSPAVGPRPQTRT